MEVAASRSWSGRELPNHAPWLSSAKVRFVHGLRYHVRRPRPCLYLGKICSDDGVQVAAAAAAAAAVAAECRSPDLQSSHLPRYCLGVRDVASRDCMVRRCGHLPRGATAITSSMGTTACTTSAGGGNHSATLFELLEAESTILVCIVTVEQFLHLWWCQVFAQRYPIEVWGFLLVVSSSILGGKNITVPLRRRLGCHSCC